MNDEVTEPTIFSTHEYIGSMDEEQQKRCADLRGVFMELENIIRHQKERGLRTFSDRCLSIALSKLEEASMYTIKAVVFEGKNVRQ